MRYRKTCWNKQYLNRSCRDNDRVHNLSIIRETKNSEDRQKFFGVELVNSHFKCVFLTNQVSNLFWKDLILSIL